MFAAGRDVKLALASEPDPNFILQERTRFLNVAGAAAQEALRDIPPPRLPFWVNARRRLLEAAASSSPAPARHFGSALRYSLSAAVVAIAIAVVALAPLGGANAPQSADAQLAALEEQIIQVELASQQGQAVSGAQLDDLADRTSQITNTLDEFDLERADKIGGLIIRQQEVAKQVSPDEPELASSQQKLAQAQSKIESAKGSPTAALAVVEATEEPAVVATAEPEPTPTPAPLQAGEVRTELASDDDYGLTWQQVTTNNISFVMPVDWRLLTVEEDQNGVPTQTASVIGIATSGDAIMIIISPYGETHAQISGVSVQLRGRGVDGDTIPAAALADLGEIGVALHHFVLSIDTTDTP
jgi:hypothetical protein